MMKHPDEVKADQCRAEARSHDDKATEFRTRGGNLRGIAPKVAESYAGAADALETLAAALRERAREFDESARLTR